MGDDHLKVLREEVRLRVLDDALEVAGDVVRRLGERVERPAGVHRHARLRLERLNEHVQHRFEHLGLEHHLAHLLADLAEYPSGGVPHYHRLVAHQADDGGQRLLDDRDQHRRGGALEDGAEGHHGGFAQVPVLLADVLGDEGHGVGDDVVLRAGGHQNEAHRGGLAGVPLVLVGVLVLVRQRLQQQGDQVGQGALRVELRGARRRAALFGGLRGLDGELNLLVADVRPELDALKGNLRLVAADRLEGDGEEGHRHVLLHVDVVEGHDLHQALKGGHLYLWREGKQSVKRRAQNKADKHTYPNVRALRRLTDDLHDKVPLLLGVKVGLGELK